MKKSRFISDLKSISPTERFQSAFLVHSKEVRQKKSGDPFLSLKLGDRTGVIDAKMWENVPAVAEAFKDGDFIDVRGKMQIFRGKHQMIVHKLTVISEQDVFLGDFIPHTACDIEELYSGILAAIAAFSDPQLKRLMSAIFNEPEFAALYKRAPAASGMHHARIGGLLEHVASLMRLAKAVAANYEDLDGDLLACGVLMHDVGKIFELSCDRTFEYTDEGRLLGHIPMGSAWLGSRCDEIDGFPPRLKTLLQHMVISHHGEKAYGSPQEPMFPEALALHFIDNLDAKLEIMRSARADMPAGTVWSAFHRGLNLQVLDKAAYLRASGGQRQAAAPHRSSTPASTGGSGDSLQTDRSSRPTTAPKARLRPVTPNRPQSRRPSMPRATQPSRTTGSSAPKRQAAPASTGSGGSASGRSPAPPDRPEQPSRPDKRRRGTMQGRDPEPAPGTGEVLPATAPQTVLSPPLPALPPLLRFDDPD